MFDFEKLIVFEKAKFFNELIKIEIISNKEIDKVYKDQIRRASISIALNIAEGVSRFSNADKRNFLVIARASLSECVAILDLLKSENLIGLEKSKLFYFKAEEISKILYTMIRGLEGNGQKK